MNIENETNEDRIFEGKYSKSVYKTIYDSMGSHKLSFIIFILIGFIGRGFLLFNANIIGLWVDNVCYQSNICKNKSNFFSEYTSTEFIYLLLTVSLVGFIFILIFRIGLARLGTHFVSNLYDKTTYNVSRFPISFFDKNPLGRIITRFSSDYAAILRMSGGPLTELLSTLFDIFLFIVLILISSMNFLPIVVICILLNYFIYNVNKIKIRNERRVVSLTRGPALAHFAETAQGAKIIRVYGKDNSFKRRFISKFNTYIKQRNKTNFYVNLFSLQLSILNIVILLLTGLFGMWLVNHGKLSIGSLGVAFTFISMISITIQIFFEWVAVMEEALTGIERMDDYLNSELEKGALINYNYSNKLQKIENGNIEVKNLSIRYNQKSSLVLDNVSFNILNGEKIGIIGKTGSGKTSLINAFYYIYPFEKGVIKINGYEPDIGQNKNKDSKYVQLDMFRNSLSLISQYPYIFSGTLRENLCFNNIIPDHDILDILALVGLKKFLLIGKKCLDLELKEMGIDLSLGEKQLICMARCLLQNNQIVIMDEATSSIDPYSENILVNATKNLLRDKTQIIVAHRLSTIEDCDRVIWLDSGKLVMQGEAISVINAFRNHQQG
ncbi:MAG: ABC transporter ATP-binding protein [Spirobacillus cienkowskii]|jgi:ABC-type multidrug transport system fused ATPase/permease subunit|uniref:ABC transporter ATP-binding protein n=1 Tax=Spirobacillus cienkowskii TaxID=495820 RepID=A0A369KXH5_9BACT|nr:MAG: ABC transporter ATP-binding protein [Spirobacillus cienkowskii]